jgi:hypothetical protein
MKLYFLYLIMLSIALLAHFGARRVRRTDTSPV